MIFAWHMIGVSGDPYPVLWYGDIPDQPGSPTKAIVRQHHILSEDEQAEVWAQPDGTRVDYLRKKYPYNDPDPVDVTPRVVIVTEVTRIVTNRTEVV